MCFTFTEPQWCPYIMVIFLWSKNSFHRILYIQYYSRYNLWPCIPMYLFESFSKAALVCVCGCRLDFWHVTGEQASRHRRSMVRETKWGDVKVIEKVACLGEVTVIPQHISTAIKMISEDSLTDTCSDSQLHHFAVHVRRQCWVLYIPSS